MLMNKWTWSTWKTLVDQDQEQRLQETWQIIAPREAASNPFLMHGMLALAALHLASESIHSPESSGEHRAVALRHHDQAIALFRPVLNDITPQNSTPVFGFSALLIILSFALPEFPLEQAARVSRVEELLTIMTLLKGVRSIVMGGLEWIREGSLKMVLIGADLTDTSIGGEIPDDFRAALARLKAHSSSLYTHEVDIVEAFSLTLDRLEECVSRLFSLPLDRPVVLGWMVTVPDRFDILLRDGHPMAQVILAHFAVILLTFDFWWAGDWGISLMRDIEQRLSDEWKPMVRWPLEQITTMNATSLRARLDAQAPNKV